MLPVIFVAHGAPTLALDQVRGEALTRWAASFPRPQAILVVSAHWESHRPALGTTRTVPLIYDFSGFPPQLYSLQYPCPGAPELAARVQTLLAAWGPVPQTQRGLDHGVWVPLRHLYPQADVPVLQMALPSHHTHRMLMALGADLAPLRQEGVLIMASGVLVHNFSAMDLSGGVPPQPWAVDFEAWLLDALSRWDLDALVNYRFAAPGGEQAAPTPEHLVPLFIAMGAAGPAQPRVSVPMRGFEYGSLSRTCLQFD